MNYVSKYNLTLIKAADFHMLLKISNKAFKKIFTNKQGQIFNSQNFFVGLGLPS